MFRKPLVIQRDGTIYLIETLEPTGQLAKQLSGFTDRIQSPEGVYSFKINPFSTWSGAARGITAKQMLDLLETNSENVIDSYIYDCIWQGASQFSLLRLSRHDNYIRLTGDDTTLVREVAKVVRENNLTPQHEDNNSLWFLIEQRRLLKHCLFDHNYFMTDASNVIGEPLYMRLRPFNDNGESHALTLFQEEAVQTYLELQDRNGGRGSIMMPPNCGKTLVALKIIEQLELSTLVLVQNLESAERWMEDLKDKTDLAPEGYSIFDPDDPMSSPFTICTYDNAAKNLNVLGQTKWGMVVYDDGHKFPVYESTADIPSQFKLGLAATLYRSDNQGHWLFLLIGPKLYDVLPRTLESDGHIQPIECIQVLVPLPGEKFIAGKSKQEVSKNELKHDAFRCVMEGTANEKVLIASYFGEIANEYANKYCLPLITGGMNQQQEQGVVTRFQNDMDRVLVFTQKAEKLNLGEATRLISLSYNHGSEREEYLRLGKLMNLHAQLKRRKRFISLVSEGCSEEVDYARRRKTLIRLGYRCTAVTLSDFQKEVLQ